jgi:hypothetical protein
MTSDQSINTPIYHKDTLEFVAVAKSYCDLLSQPESIEEDRFLEIMQRILPLLYLKGALLPQTTLIDEGYIETFATETHYGLIVETILSILGENDAYIETYHPDIALADGAVAASIAEGLADIWQEMYDFVEVFRLGYDETMNEALYQVKDHFLSGWGQTVLNVSRAIHALLAKENELMDSEPDLY